MLIPLLCCRLIHFLISSTFLVFHITIIKGQIIENLNLNVTLEQTIFSPLGYAPPFIKYFQRSYLNITNEIKRLAKSKECSDILYVTSAQEMFKNRPGVNLNAEFFKCGEEPCETLIVRLASKATLTSSTPEIFLSGALHGDERLGPNTVFELISLTCHMYGKHPIITYLMESRSIWMTPITNAWGYAHNEREENGIDPNRDFPYLRAPQDCMATIAGRIINELFLDHLFQLAVTFHGGTRVMSYEWGSFDHIDNKGSVNSHHILKPTKSLESPDLASQKDLAEALQHASGWLAPNHQFSRREYFDYRKLTKEGKVLLNNNKTIENYSDDKQTIYDPLQQNSFNRSLQSENWNFNNNGSIIEWFYPIGSTSDLVYPVDGGFEDWSYSSSWQASPKPISICQPITYGGYPSSRTNYTSTDSFRASTFLIEMDYLKNPPDWQFGHSYEVIYPSGLEGHIPRNIRLLLKLIELVEPDILLLRPPQIISSPTSPSSILSMELLPIGCRRIDSIELILLFNSCNSMIPLHYNLTDPSFAILPNLGRSISLIDTPVKCSGIGIWENWKIDTKLLRINEESFHREGIISIKTPLYDDDLSHPGLCLMARGVFDQHWGIQHNPDPSVRPQTHVARTRLLDTYQVFAGNQTIESTRIKLFPKARSWGGSKWRHGIDLELPIKQFSESFIKQPSSIRKKISSGPMYFNINPEFNDRRGSLPFWTATFSSALKNPKQDKTYNNNQSIWDPFVPSKYIDNAINALSIQRKTQGDEFLNRINIETSIESGLKKSVEFVLRIWDSDCPIYLGNPLDVKKLRLKNSEALTSIGDGELIRWQLDSDGRFVIGSSRVGLSPSIQPSSISRNGTSHNNLRISFIPRVTDFDLLPLKTLAGRVLTLETILLDTVDPMNSGKSPIGHTSISTTVLDHKSHTDNQESVKNFLCILTNSNYVPMVSFKPNRLDPSWFNNPRIVEEAIEGKTKGFVLLDSSKNEIQLSAKVCRMQSDSSTTNFDTIQISSTSECQFPVIQVNRPPYHFFNPFQERYFSIVNTLPSSSRLTCHSGNTLQASILSEHGEYVNATCALKPTQLSVNFYLKTFCNSKTLRPLDNSNSISVTQQFLLGGLAVVFLFCASIPIIDVMKNKRGYAQVNQSFQ